MQSPRSLWIRSLIALSLTMTVLSCKNQSSDTSPTNKPAQTTENVQANTPENKSCTYSLEPQDVKVQWTAYKFNEKAAVKGGFNQTTLSGPRSATSLKALVQGMQMEIDGNSFESGDPGRNATVRQFFFEKLTPPFKLHGTLADLQGDEQSGQLTLNITLNGNTQKIPFTYQSTPEGSFIAQGKIDLLQFGAQGAFDSLHKACEVQHTGKDGVSKTWTEVDLQITAPVKKQCEESH